MIWGELFPVFAGDFQRREGNVGGSYFRFWAEFEGEGDGDAAGAGAEI